MNSPKSSKLLYLCPLYALGVALIWGVQRFTAAPPPFFALVGAFLPFLFAPLLLWLPLAWRYRSRLALIPALGLLMLFGALYGPRFLPRLSRGPRDAAGGPRLTVMTFNLRYEYYEPARLATAIVNSGADVVAVQELAPSRVPALQAAVAAAYPHAIWPAGGSGVGFLSRYPIVEHTWFRPAGTGRAALQAELDVAGVPVAVLALHPYPPGIRWLGGTRVPTGLWYRPPIAAQMRDVVQRVAAFDGPAVVLGDCNMSEQSRGYAVLAAALHDAYREAGWGFGFTFPQDVRLGRWRVPGPFVRIDYVFHTEDFYAQRAWITCEAASDHCYVRAELALDVRF